jgi:hypothetical protein
MQKHELKANVIISGPIFPEPVQVMMTHDMGHLVKVIGKGLRTEKFHIPSDLVVDSWTSDGERRSPRAFLFLHDI